MRNASAEARQQTAERAMAVLGGLLEQPSGAARKAARELAEKLAAEPTESEAEERPRNKDRPAVVRVAVAGSRRQDGDTGPGPGVWSVPIAAHGDPNLMPAFELLNPFPYLGEEDPRDYGSRRAMAIGLHARWLSDGKTKAGEMLMTNGEPLPVDLVPVCKEAKAVTGAEAMEELRRILRHARASGVEVVRFIDSRECWQGGNESHGEELAQLLRNYQQVEADGYTPVEAIQAAAEAVPERRRSSRGRRIAATC